MKPLIALLAILVVLSFQVALAQAVNASELEKQLDEAVPAILQRTGNPSASVAVVLNARLAVLKAYGDSRLSPATPSSIKLRYGIGSISKQFTAAAVLLLAEEGKLSLDDPVSKYHPDVHNSGSVTVRELLTHTAGYRDDLPDNFVPVWMAKPTTPVQVLKQWAHAPLDFVPGTKFEYSNTDYIIAGLVIEKVSGMNLSSFFVDRIFRPLDMHSAAFITDSVPSNVDVTGYFRYALGSPRPAILQAPGWLYGGGELLMDAEDLAKWDISILNESLLEHHSYRELEKDTLLKNGMATGYGLGLRLSMVQGHRRLEHAGEISGFYAENIQLPDDKAAVVVLTNMEVPAAATEIADGVIDMVLRGSQESAGSEERVRRVLVGLQHGSINRNELNADANAYFNDQALHDFETSLAPLGSILSLSKGEVSKRAGQRFLNYVVRFQSASILVKTAEDKDGKFAQFLIEPTK